MVLRQVTATFLTNTKTPNVFRMATFSDVHLGHRSTPTTRIVSTLMNMFPDNDRTKKLDMIVIAGDVYDRDLYVYDDNVALINAWIKHFLEMCKKYDIVVRVLEGTPSHDWKQSRTFIDINELYDINADIKYVSAVEIEYIEKFNLNALYVPDEWRLKCSDTWEDVKECLARHNLTKVDFCFMHGAFPHQLPKLWDGAVEMHNPDNYLSITNYYVVIGHIHQYSQHNRILSSGSPQRLMHGDEGDKGFLYFTIKKDGNDKIEFVVNKDAVIYKTVDLKGLSTEEALSKAHELASKYPSGSHFRITCSKSDPAASILTNLRRVYQEFYWEFKSTDERKTGQLMAVIQDNRRAYCKARLTQDNLISELLKRVELNRPDIVKQCESTLRSVVDDGNIR